MATGVFSFTFFFFFTSRDEGLDRNGEKIHSLSTTVNAAVDINVIYRGDDGEF